MFQIIPSTKTLIVITIASVTPAISNILDQVLAAKPVITLLAQGVLWCLSVTFVFLGVLNRWKEYKSKPKQ